VKCLPRCVAKYDHHCIWVNNCIGLKNYRYFVLFLAANLVATFYGAVAIWIFLYEQISRFMHRPVIDQSTGKVFRLASSPMMLVDFLVFRFPALFGLGVLNVAFFCIVAGFLVYHLCLIAVGKTTNETFKWNSKSDCGRSNAYDLGLWRNFKLVFFPPIEHVKQS